MGLWGRNFWGTLYRIGNGEFPSDSGGKTEPDTKSTSRIVLVYPRFAERNREFNFFLVMCASWEAPETQQEYAKHCIVFINQILWLDVIVHDAGHCIGKRAKIPLCKS